MEVKEFVMKIDCFDKKHEKWEVLQKNSTNTIRGIAILLIVISHIIQYIGNEISLNDTIKMILLSFGAVGVSMFFFLSGYGNYISLSKKESKREMFRNILIQVIRLIAIFIICFITTTVIRLNFYETVTIKKIVYSLMRLEIIGTTTWYLKIQLLMYLFTIIGFWLEMSHLNNKVSGVCVVVFASLLYVFFAQWNNFADFWWKTGMCYSTGMVFGKYRNNIQMIIKKYWLKIMGSSVLLISSAYLWILKDNNYIVGMQLLAYIVISSGICILNSMLQIQSNIMTHIGKMSLPIYLIHIGLAEILLSNFTYMQVRVFLYCILTTFFAELVNVFDKKIVKLKKYKKMN